MMFNIRKIIKQNRETFYDYSTGEQSSVLLDNILKVLAAAILMILFCNLSKDFLDATLTIYSILIGFSFNILFYLLSTQKEKICFEADTIEKKIRIKKTNKISDELFYNVSYFNITSMLVVVTALIFFLFDSRLPQFTADLTKMILSKDLLEKVEPNLIYIRHGFSAAYRLLLYFLIIESLYTFVRTTGRVSFFFQQKLTLRNEEQDVK